MGWNLWQPAIEERPDDVTSQLVCDVPIAVPIMAGTSPATTENDTPFDATGFGRCFYPIIPALSLLTMRSLNPFQGLVGVSTREDVYDEVERVMSQSLSGFG